MEAIEDIKMASVYFKANKNPCDTFNLCDTKWVQKILNVHDRDQRSRRLDEDL